MYAPKLEVRSVVKVFDYEKCEWTDWQVSFIMSCTSPPFEVRLVCLMNGKEERVALYSDTAVFLFKPSCNCVIPRVSRFRGQFEYLSPGQESVSKAHLRYYQRGNVGHLRVSIRGKNTMDVVRTTFPRNGACWCGGEVHPRSVVPLEDWRSYPSETPPYLK